VILDKHIFLYIKIRKMKCIAKKEVKISFLLLLLSLSLNACLGGFGFIFKEHLFGNYYLTAPDVIEQCNLTYRSETYGDSYGTIIGQTVFAIGYNDKYLIAKRYYQENPDGRLDKSKIQYYILPLKDGMNWRTENGLIGPLDSLTFENMRKELGVSGLKFTKQVDIP
jgi:hypothetical protein